jgi:hypothetical protein
VGLTALTAASFCVFLTLETAATFLAAVVLRAAGFGAGLLALAVAALARFGFAAALRATVLRAAGFAAVARLAFSLADGLAAAGFALTARFAVFAGAFFAFERVGDRRKPFVRLLLMGWNLKRLLTINEQPLESRAAYHSLGPKSTNTSICGCFKPISTVHLDKRANKEKHLMHIVGYVKVRLAYGGLKHLGTSPQPNK